jgi:2-oxoglutarate ferredoxin oxidoreductase subunit alpha
MSERLAQVEGGVFIQAESEIAAIHMVIGASMAGGRVMTSSSSPGISLKQEGISFLSALELPAVIVNMTRGGPGLGNIAPAQSDYFQATRGGGHGDYRTIVLAPHSVQEMHDLAMLAFDLADLYRNPVVILADAVLGQMNETLEDRSYKPMELPPKDWTLTGASGRKPNLIKSLYLKEGEMEKHNWKLFEKYQSMKKEIRYESSRVEDAQMIVAAFGTSARVAKSAIQIARSQGLKVGLFRPITLYPFPGQPLLDLSQRTKKFLSVEMNTGQMVEDVKLSVARDADVHFYGHPPGSPPDPEEVFEAIQKVY